jgi:hypothetical protein
MAKTEGPALTRIGVPTLPIIKSMVGTVLSPTLATHRCAPSEIKALRKVPTPISVPALPVVARQFVPDRQAIGVIATAHLHKQRLTASTIPATAKAAAAGNSAFAGILAGPSRS